MSKTVKLTIAAMCLAIAIVLPQATHFLAEFARKISIMHIPVYMSGILCGPLYGLLVGLLSPFLSMALFHMPTGMTCWSMMIELGAYGFFSGLFFNLIKTKSSLFNIYASLILSMLIGKIIYGICNALVFKAGEYSFAIWISAAFIDGILGIILHLIIIPSICMFLSKRINYNK